jgi:hypothetical protein
VTAVEDLSTLLWRQHELLDLLLFKAGEKQYIVVSDNLRWLPRIAAEIETILSDLSTVEDERATLVAQVATERDMPSLTPSLREIAAVVGPPWEEVLMSHHENLLKIVTDIRTLSDANRDLIEKGLAAVNDSLHLNGPASAGTYNATGRAAGDAPALAVTLDGAL